ncbi:MAG: MFS transporter [Bacteroidaceae bacterium]|nr:MFS transporter [Bacteroidaceae bacterium]
MSEKKNQNIVAIITMIFLFGMVGFVTNLAAPVANIWKNQPGINGSNALGMMGNMMNFLAYLFMGIPAGKMLYKNGSKKTILIAITVGFLGVFVQYLSGVIGVNPANTGIPASYFVYLLGAFISGFSVCMLNTVVNPMLTLLGGDSKRGNQFVQIGGTFNSLMGTLTPMLVGALIGTITPATAFKDINLVLYIAMAVFVLAFVVINFLTLVDPDTAATTDDKDVPNPWKYRHFIMGVFAIFCYVGVEVGTPGTLNLYLSDATAKGGGLSGNAAAIAGFCAGSYWFLMLIGRFASSLISGKVSSRVQLAVTSGVTLLLVLCAIFSSKETLVSMPVFNGHGFGMETVPVAALLLVLVGLCTSVMWGCIFNLAVEGLGKATALASGIFMTMVVGGGILPLIQNFIADKATYMTSYWLVIAGFGYIFFYALVGSKPKNK